MKNDNIDEENRKQIFDAIDKMASDHDLDGNGLDFKELYKASGGNLDDLWST